MSEILKEPFIRWPRSMTLRLRRIGATPLQVVALQLLTDFPEESPGVVWMSAKRLAKELYPSVTKTSIRDAERLLEGLVDSGFLQVAEKYATHRAYRYRLDQLRAWVLSVDVTDVYPKATAPVASVVSAPKARTRKATRVTKAKGTVKMNAAAPTVSALRPAAVAATTSTSPPAPANDAEPIVPVMPQGLTLDQQWRWSRAIRTSTDFPGDLTWPKVLKWNSQQTKEKLRHDWYPAYLDAEKRGDAEPLAPHGLTMQEAAALWMLTSLAEPDTERAAA